MENTLNKEELFKVWEICESSWQHRDSIMWKVMLSIFYGIVVFNGLPYIFEKLNNSSLCYILPSITFMCSFCFLFISLSYGARLEAVGSLIKNIRKEISLMCEQVKLNETSFKGSIFINRHMVKWIPFCMFIALIFIDFVSLNFLLGKKDLLLVLLSNLFWLLLTASCVILSLLKKDLEEIK